MISIIIVNYKTSDYIEKCIKSIKDFCTLDLEIIVIDNNSNDSGLFKLEEDFPSIKFIRNNENSGFGKACNIAKKISNGEYLLFLNPDIIVYPNSIEYLFEYYVKLNNPGILTGKLINENNEIQYSYNKFPDIRWELKEATSIGLKADIRNLINKIELSKKEIMQIDWAHGAVLMIRKDLFDKIQGFDEDYFLYYEDVDFQKRLADIRKTNYLILNSKFYHHERSSIDPDKPRIIYFHNMHYHKLLYYKKHHKPYKRIILRLLFIISYCLRIFLLPLAVKSFKEFKNKFLEYKTVLNVYFRKVN